MAGIIDIIDNNTNSIMTRKIEQRPVLVGRSPACDIVLEFSEVSRRHCMFEVRNNKYWLVDLASANGTFINLQQIKEKELDNGDIITLGKNDRWQLRFQITQSNITEDTKLSHQVILNDTTHRSTLEKSILETEDYFKDTSTEHTITTSRRDITAFKSKNQFNILYRISRILMSSLDLDRLLELMIDEIMAVLPADRGCVVLADKYDVGNHPQLTVKAYKQKAELSKSIYPEFQLSRTIIKKAMDEQLALLLLDLDSNEKFQSSETIIKQGIRSSICAPIKGKDKILGVIYLDSQSGSQAFSESNLDMLTAIANQAGIAVENALLWEKMRRYSEELEEEVRLRTKEISFERNRLSAILRCMGEGLVVGDTSNQITLTNPAANKILNIKSNSNEVTNILAFYPLEIQQMAGNLLNRLQEDNSPDTFSEVLRISLDNKHIRVNLAPIRDEGNNFLGMVLLNQDITKEVEMEQMKADFISMLTHDLKNPLTVIISSSQLILKGYLGPIDTKTEEQIKAVYRNGQIMLELVNNFLDVSKIEAGRMSIGKYPVSIIELVNNVTQNFQMQANEFGIDIIKEIDNNIPEIIGDPFQLERVLSNLISNAVKFTSKPGYVKVGVKYLENKMEIYVSDSGEGIPPDELPNLFNRYFRTASAQEKIKGTGLGLYIVKFIVEAHNGYIFAVSEPGKGTTFTVTLPMTIKI